jgi:UDP-N-acetylmuramoyl-tripeptide--D-alanyl-D-alanine ligase
MHPLFDSLPKAKQAAHALRSADLAPAVAAFLRPGDAVLVKGSLGMRMKTIVVMIDKRGEATGVPAR